MFACVCDVRGWNVGACTSWHCVGLVLTFHLVGGRDSYYLLLCTPGGQVLRLPGCLCVLSPNRDTGMTVSRLYVVF